MNAGTGRDTVSGGSGSGSGNDQIFGGSGSDSLDGGNDNDLIHGDSITLNPADHPSGPDGLPVTVTFINGADGPVNQFWIDGGSNTLFYGTIPAGGSIPQPTFANHNWFLTDSTGQPLQLYTATGNQTRTYGAEGLNDSISGGAGNDTIYGQFGNDTMDGGTGNDFIDSGTGNDSIVGGDGSDTIIGGTGDNILFGNVGHDSLDGGTGQDFPWGDTSADTLDGGSGCDVVQYRDSDAAVNINLSDALAESSAHAQGDMLRNIEQIDGSEFNDTITAGSSDLVVKGLRGNDSITGGAGRDFLQGATAMTASLAGQETIL